MLACNELVDDLAAEEEQFLQLELDTCFPDLKIEEAVRFGCRPDFAARLKSLLDRYRDYAPLKVHLKDGDKPVRCKARRYSLPQREFMEKHVRDLENTWFVYRNPTSRWASTPLRVRKPHTENEFRMTVDLRPVNAQTEQIAWPMPMLEVVVDHLAGSSWFFSWISSKVIGNLP
ncbi:hypothetical protein Ae201684P_003444 [Aphanomyces euteiches]|uniref:Uncharacterized protein n=1 Tax=Aphanomyces euteiches TaxID=100861 RepID=A0A6G0W7I1_9STRA|nr:hypothetical protein Ae201684_018401 [Aphanomyces euteiches]KAH9064655.1 hypothetical protein Ae201684P_003444 [Aphanomyces euteiches]